LHALLDHVVELARRLKVTKGRKLRIDGTVVATNVHYPVDSTLLEDGVRVVTRLLRRAGTVLHGGAAVGKRTLDNLRQHAHQRMLDILQAARQRGNAAEAAMKTAYQDLTDLTQRLVEQAYQTQRALEQQGTASARRLVTHLTSFLPRVRQVIDQTTRRVLRGQSVPAPQKLVSLFEPHTAIIRKGKPGHEVEFGRVVWLDEVEGSIITRFAVLAGNPPDADQLQPSLDHHQAVFDRCPSLLAGDRKVFSPQGEAYAIKQGVKHVVLPKPGTKSPTRLAHEAQPWFRSGRNWRSGHEAHIGLLKRRFRLDRCRYHGDDGMARWVGWGVIAFDLWSIARQVA
jgi:IS5 family transposase